MRLALVALVALAFLASWRAARWYMGSEFALLAPLLPAEDAMSTAESAVRLAPADPMSHRSLGELLQRELTPGALQRSIREFEQAVSLSPGDFRLWIDLGRAREQAGDYEAAEKALRRSIELAPYYSWPRWHLGNFLMRRGRRDEGMAELRRVVEADASKRHAVFDLAWQVYGGDARAVASLLGASGDARVEFINYLLARQRLDEAAGLWSELKEEERKSNAATARALFDRLVAARRFRDALALSQYAGQGGAKPEVGKITNGGFESGVTQNSTNIFDWHVPSGSAQVQPALDSANPHEGGLSLRINFNAPGALDFTIKQEVALEPAASYRLVFYVRTNNLKSAALPLVQVVGAEGKVLGESQPVPVGKTDWQQFVIDFKTPKDVDAITLRITRGPCMAEGVVCPIYGTVWYDDFNLQLVGRESL